MNEKCKKSGKTVAKIYNYCKKENKNAEIYFAMA